MFSFRRKTSTTIEQTNTNKIDYSFECLNLSDYQLTFTFDLENKFLLSLFNKAKEKINLKDANPDLINQFEVENKYLNYVKTTIGSQIKTVSKEVSADGIVILNEKVTKVVFKRREDSKDWKVIIYVVGQYADKRIRR